MKKEEDLIVIISDKYKRILCNLIKNGREANLPLLLKDGSPTLSSLNVLDMAKENLNHDQRFIIHIHLCLSLLNEDERDIIWKDFFVNEPRNKKIPWWSYHYARSTYYRIRSRAIKKFYDLCK